MRMYDIIAKKRDGGELTREEIDFFLRGYVAGEIPDYQAASLLMAITLKGMTAAETASLTLGMAASGGQVDLSTIDGVKVDKHSTGGVGDKTTLIVTPVVASLGVHVAKMSGRGLGYTGGTIDKLESIPGFRTSLAREEFFEIVRRVGAAVVSQSGNLVPADKKLYALRDVTATVESIPLIASSIMSKKLAAGSDCIVLDVKTGSGAFMKTFDDSLRLAETMVAIGEHAGRRTVALITDMSSPLGRAAGNSLEVCEACETLKGCGPADLTELCAALAGEMLCLAGCGNAAECRAMARRQMTNGAGYAEFREMVAAQGGDVSVLDDNTRFPQAKVCRTVCARESGWVRAMDTEQCGAVCGVLGAGREKKDDPVDFSAGIVFLKKTGDRVKEHEPFAVFYTSEERRLAEAERLFEGAVQIGAEAPEPVPLIHARVTRDGVERYGK
jgi:pyrimidine-nucleoside phosphorylase